MSDLDVFANQYVPNAQAEANYAKWLQQNPNERQRWEAFRNAVLAGQAPVAPAMTTAKGKGLVAAGSMAYDPVGPPPPPPPPPSGTKLSWAPPALSNPITVAIPNTGFTPAPYGYAGQPWVVTLPDANQDYIIKIDHRHETAQPWAGLSISGGRHVVSIGGEIEIPRTDPSLDSQRDALVFSSRNGITHVEGLWIHGAPNRGIGLRSTTVYQIQNCRIDDIFMWNEDVNAAHSDVIITQGAAPSELRVDRFTADFDNTGFALYEDGGTTRLRNVNLIATGLRSDLTPTSHPLAGNGVSRYPNTFVELQNVWTTVGWARATVGPWPNPGQSPWGLAQGWWSNAFGTVQLQGDGFSAGSVMTFTNPSGDKIGGDCKVRVGTPPGGDFVPAGLAGRSYVSPGYL